MSSFPFHVKEHKVPCQHVREWPRATANSQEDVLYLHVKQYIPKDNPSPQPGDVTIIGTHANGFPKELYEALWSDLHSEAAKQSPAFRIRGIWIADTSNQGYSGELNEASLGNDPCWHDLSRDLLHLTNVFRAEMPGPIVGVGHSFGANVLAHLSLLHPRLLSTLVLLDPTIIVFDPARSSGPGTTPARASAFRRDLWPSRADAVASFARSPFYRTWDPRVLDAWNRHAIRDLPTPLYPALPDSEGGGGGGATLRTTKHQEVFTFFRPLYPYLTTSTTLSSSSLSTAPENNQQDNHPKFTISKSGAPDYDPALISTLPPGQPPFPFYRSEGGVVLHSLPYIRPSVLFIHGGSSDLSTPQLRHLRVSTCGIGPGGSGGGKDGKVRDVVMPDMGHLFPMQDPSTTAAHTASWIAEQMVGWRQEQVAYEAWTRRPMSEKNTLSKEFVEKVGRPEGKGKGKGSKKAGEAKL
ncbi:Alpha/beta hydrolase family-domain-containing protein [Xylariaceae sp. FL0594]|nr:Alpha/beta hydrolase family-domain-containing protein [Xylariaceae sp. FL0594]